MPHYNQVFSIRRLWIIFGASMVVMFGALLYFGVQIYHTKPPIPGAVRTGPGQILYTGDDIRARPGRLAIDRRHAAGLDLGPWRLCRARLERGLAAPRGDRAARQIARTGTQARRSTALASPIRRGSAPSSGARCARNGYDPRHRHVTVSDQRATGDGRSWRHFRAVHQPDARGPASARALRDAANA